jgi:hypothetical protein
MLHSEHSFKSFLVPSKKRANILHEVLSLCLLVKSISKVFRLSALYNLHGMVEQKK